MTKNEIKKIIKETVNTLFNFKVYMKNIKLLYSYENDNELQYVRFIDEKSCKEITIDFSENEFNVVSFIENTKSITVYNDFEPKKDSYYVVFDGTLYTLFIHNVKILTGTLNAVEFYLNLHLDSEVEFAKSDAKEENVITVLKCVDYHFEDSNIVLYAKGDSILIYFDTKRNKFNYVTEENDLLESDTIEGLINFIEETEHIKINYVDDSIIFYPTNNPNILRTLEGEYSIKKDFKNSFLHLYRHNQRCFTVYPAIFNEMTERIIKMFKNKKSVYIVGEDYE